MRIAVIIPSYRVSKKILSVVSAIGPEVHGIFVVDDKCPDQSGKIVAQECKDPRVKIIFQEKNEGVGGATLRGFAAAKKAGYQILVKLDGDGQMDPRFIPALIRPILEKKADYTKGNRFHSPRSLKGMPTSRLIGNAGLSFLAKITTGYWNLMDPTNGFLAMHANILSLLDMERVSKRYFFENDMLFRLGLIQAHVVDVPMKAVYADEKSNLSISHSLATFPFRFLIRIVKRIFYRYFLRDFSVGSVLLLAGIALLSTGSLYGLHHWLISIQTGQLASSGRVMIAALPVLLGFQMLTFALLFDVMMTPKEALFPYLDSSEEQS
jgi:dolichol-phosphate mannosyltransferase